MRDGHDLRYYENVLLHVNRQQGRAGITGNYQSPGIFGGGGNNVQLVAGHRIWLVSPSYAKAIEHVVPSGSLSGGAVAKGRRSLGHIEDILSSVARSPDYVDEILGEYAQAVRTHMPEIVGVVSLFIMAEATSALLAATPTGVGQIAAVAIQLGLSAIGASGAIQAGSDALRHATEWLTIAWTAQGRDERITLASKEFLKMWAGILIAALSVLGAKANYGNALKIARTMPTGGLPALAVAGGGQFGNRVATGVLLGPGPGSFAVAGNAMMQADNEHGGNGRDAEGSRKDAEGSRKDAEGSRKDVEGSKDPEASAKPDRGNAVGEAGLSIPPGLDKRLAKLADDVMRRARDGKLLKSNNYQRRDRSADPQGRRRDLSIRRKGRPANIP